MVYQLMISCRGKNILINDIAIKVFEKRVEITGLILILRQWMKTRRGG